jgi:hypothetical protein
VPIFWPDDTDFSNPANTRHPSQDFDADGKYLADLVAAVVAASGTSGDPQAYGQTAARRLFPDVLPYVVGTPATRRLARRAPSSAQSHDNGVQGQSHACPHHRPVDADVLQIVPEEQFQLA